VAGKFQREVDAYIQKFEEGYWPPLVQLAALVEELGEVSRYLMALSGDKPLRGNDDPLLGLREELGDVMVALACVANQYDIDLFEAGEASLAKYETMSRSFSVLGALNFSFKRSFSLLPATFAK